MLILAQNILNPLGHISSIPTWLPIFSGLVKRKSSQKRLKLTRTSPIFFLLGLDLPELAAWPTTEILVMQCLRAFLLRLPVTATDATALVLGTSNGSSSERGQKDYFKMYKIADWQERQTLDIRKELS